MRIKSSLLSLFALVIVVSSASARPGMVACAISAKESPSTASQQQLLVDSRDRIQSLFGPLEADPVIVFFDDANAYWPLRLNSYGSASFVGSKTCVMIGPDGQNVDVTAHELMHAELAQRLGFWKRSTQLPTWFDEGLAMQVDFRSRYALSTDEDSALKLDEKRAENDRETRYVLQLDSPADFYVADGEELTRNYRAAKAQVARWLAEQEAMQVFTRLEGLRSGQRFEEIVRL